MDLRLRPTLGRALAALLLLPGLAHADEGRARMRATRAPRPPRIDGRLDDAVWRAASPSDHFVQQFPAEGAAPTERTEVRVLYDDRAVYVGVRLEDSAADEISVRLTRRDRDVETDWLCLVFDSQDDRRTGYLFQLSAAGVQVDSLIYDDSAMNNDWDAVWDGEVTRDRRGWTAEFAIPLSVLRFRAASAQEWGFQLYRHVSRKNETVMWSFKPLAAPGEVRWFGRLEGFERLRPRRILELRPFAALRVGTEATGTTFFGSGATDVRTTGQPELGLDAKVGLSSGLVLDATVNPDFGQVEADQVVLNLTRFETFFPEKRPFFLEGSDVYGTPLALFYSRRVGRPPVGVGAGGVVVGDDGRPLVVDSAPAALRIWSALKATGALSDRLTLGVLGVVTAPEEVSGVDADGAARAVELAPARTTAVARARLALGERGYVGLLATAASRLGGHVYRASLDHDAYAQGLDGYLLVGQGRYRLTGQLVLSERVGGWDHATPDGRPCPDPAAEPGCRRLTRLDGTAMGAGALGWGGVAQLKAVDGRFYLDASARALSPRFDVNDVGFVQPWNQVLLRTVGGYNVTRPTGGLQSHGVFGIAQATSTFDGVLTDASLGLHLEGQLRRSYLYLVPEVALVLPGTWDTVETLDGGRLQRAQSVRGSLDVVTDPRHAVSASGSAWAVRALDLAGDGAGAALTLTWRASPRLELSLGPDLGLDRGAVRLASCLDEGGEPCTAESAVRGYEFVRLDSAYLSLTTRGTLTFTPRLTLQWYAQLFTARADGRDPLATEAHGPRPFVRFGDLRPAGGEAPGDFQDASLNVNAVLRWEYRPGSSLFAVYTRAQQALVDLAGRRPAFGLGGFDAGPTEDVFLVKLVYFVR